MKVVDGKMLKGWENGSIAHEFWENQVKGEEISSNLFSPGMTELKWNLFSQSFKMSSTSSRWTRRSFLRRKVSLAGFEVSGRTLADFKPARKTVSSLNVSTYLIPYVCGFDHEFLLGLKDKVEDKFPQTWSTIRNLQYIVRSVDLSLEILRYVSELISASFRRQSPQISRSFD